MKRMFHATVTGYMEHTLFCAQNFIFQSRFGEFSQIVPVNFWHYHKRVRKNGILKRKNRQKYK